VIYIFRIVTVLMILTSCKRKLLISNNNDTIPDNKDLLQKDFSALRLFLVSSPFSRTCRAGKEEESLFFLRFLWPSGWPNRIM